LLAGIAIACATPKATIEEQRAYDEAVSVLPDNPEEAALRLEDFLRNHRQSPLAEEAAFTRAKLALAIGDRSRAVFWFGWLVRNHPRGDRSDLARVELARLQAQTGDVDMARRVLRDVRIRWLSPEQKRLAYRLRAELSEDRAERLQWLAAGRAAAVESGVSEEAVLLIDAEIMAAVDDLTLSELRRAWELLDGRPPAGRVGLRLAQESMDIGEYEDASHDLRVAATLALGDADRTLLEELSLRMELYEQGRGVDELLPSFAEVAAQPEPSREGASGTIGVVLPLTGPYSSYGEESLRGILFAARIFGAEREAAGAGAAAKSGRVRVIVRDSGGDPSRAAAAVRDLAQLDDVVAIVGPLRSGSSEAAARVAEEEGVPLLTLTNLESVPRDRPNVFRFRTTPEDELRYLVNYTFENLEARRFAVLYPEDGYGRGMRDYFWSMVDERGGWLVAASAYDPDSTDFGKSIQALIGYELLTRREHRALAEREGFLRRGRRLRPSENALLARQIASDMIGPEGERLPPIVDFDALFIPDDYEQLKGLLPQLAFNELTGVQLLGAGNWNNPELIDIARDHVSGAVISALFDPNSRFEFVAKFVEGYRLAFEREPDAFSAQAYDAANIVLVQLARGFETRNAVREGVLRTQAYPGASGVTSLSPDGNARKRPFLLQVRGRRTVPLD
jgi:ABC-type branched-subunit amino acid transport system substrate-binding protein